ncbi:MAG: hypothetical protein Q9160_002915 [Pyrenula sp. 1 TL-2023]
MRSKNQPHGKLYKVLSSTEDVPTNMRLPKEARGHMVLVLGWASQWNWVRVATITSSAASTMQYMDYLPIYPSKKNQHNGVQLKLCNDWEGWTYMEKKSYVKMDEVYEIPLKDLKPARMNGRQYELQSKSWEKILNFIQKRKSGAVQDCTN